MVTDIPDLQKQMAGKWRGIDELHLPCPRLQDEYGVRRTDVELGTVWREGGTQKKIHTACAATEAAGGLNGWPSSAQNMRGAGCY